nr:VOC family protein [Micromonospora provocatoris]
MGIHRLNHAVLYVSDLERSVAFYGDVLGFRRVPMTPEGFRGAAFLQAPDSTNDHDLGLFEIGAAAGASQAGRATVGLYHLAWELDTLDELAATAERLSAAGALVGASDHGTTKSLYGRDPDGLEFEIVWIVPATGSTTPRSPRVPASGGSTSTVSGSATAGRPAAAWASPSRSERGSRPGPPRRAVETAPCRPTPSCASCSSASSTTGSPPRCTGRGGPRSRSRTPGVTPRVTPPVRRRRCGWWPSSPTGCAGGG